MQNYIVVNISDYQIYLIVNNKNTKRLSNKVKWIIKKGFGFFNKY